MKTKLNGILTLLLALVVQVAFAQQTVTGKVTDPAGEPILGATVLVRGSSNATTTDFDGNYTILARPGEVLTYQFSGYDSQNITLGTQSVINISLKTSLEAVVVTSYRTSSKAKSNVAASTVTNETIENRPNASFVQTLEGQVAGLNIFTTSGQPGGNSVVNLRGIGSINGNTEPLFIIDGAPVDEDNFRSLNPQEIAEVTVLKDAGATSIYGNRGSNGVIIIKTKRGSFNSPLRISANTILSFNTLQDNDYNRLNSQQLLTLERQQGVGRGATLSDAEIAAADNFDWTDYFFRTGVSKNNTLSLTSGGENSSQFTSLGYFEQDGILINSNLKRFNVRSNVTGKSENDRFQYNTNLSMNYSRSDEPNNVGTGGINRNYLLGALQSVPYITPDDYTNGGDLTSPLSFTNTPLFLLDLGRTFERFEEEIKLLGSANFSYQLTDNITARSVSSFDYQNISLTRSERPDSFNALLFGGEANPTAGFQDQSTTRQFSFNQLTSLGFNKTFNDLHTIDVGLYTEYFKAHLRSFGYFANGLDGRTFSPGDGSGFVGARLNEDADGILFNDTARANILNSGLFSYFASADYDYDGKYGLGATIRRDASSRFADTFRYATFYSVSGRWNLSEEDFLEGNETINSLKLRASYGTTGNQNIVGGGYFGGLNLTRDFFVTGGGYSNNNALFPGPIPNPFLKWETTSQFNVGVDYALFDNRLRGSLDFYTRTTDDLYQSTPISGTVGTGGFLTPANFGSLTNRGIDLELRYDIIRGQERGDFELEAFFVGNYNQNELDELPGDDGQVIGVGREGGPIGEYFSVRYAGVNPANGNLLFLTADGDLTESPNPDTDRVFLDKNITPEYQGSFGFNADFKGFFFQSQFQYAGGIDRFDNDLSIVQDITSLGQFNLSEDLLRAWTPDNRVTDIPSLNATNLDFASTRYLRESDYVRLRFVTLGYSFNRDVLQKMNLTNLKLFVNAENLVTFTKWRGFDAAGYQNGSRQYPTPKIVSFGVEIGI
ncbi:TonB-linked outer membrane protein, SusC/RagA family [Nonlabens sp. Hel1_33_55]|uniref:SusC/RagA family TonB-linked outer membrane protein n=1 Tax=Nonlabens sp. Hel1_33_55 TaxID=1336802 RepID=UPI000875CA61|nr:SusC/RagA family TonB-linked outer membrane protein [Nonlabens sp. Hel1_33_55]SCY22046.1 TonB-linked outer membrane protein, SusC/RagA family [Nonlabens sp. Hel1_33_55]